MTSLSPSASSLSSDDLASSLTGGQRTSPTNSLNSDVSSGGPEMKLHCTICSETFRSPKVLHCVHSFCTPCLETLSAQDGPDRVICPECHVMTKLPSGGVNALLPDYGMIRLLNANASQFPGTVASPERFAGSSSRTPMPCTSCKGTEKFAQAQCIDCANLLCSNCVVAHQLMHCFNRHRVYPLTESYRNNAAFGFSPASPGTDFILSKFDLFGRPLLANSGAPLPEKVAIPCPSHSSERLEYFCNSCDMPICKDCLVIEHPKGQHDVAAMAEIGQREVAKVMQLKERAQAKSDELAVTSSEPHVARMTSSYHTAQTAIEDTFQFYTQVLKERRDELLQSLEGIYEDRQNGLNVMQERVVDCRRRLTSLGHFMDRLLTYGNDAEILLFKRQLNFLMDNIMASYAETSYAWNGDIQFVTNYQAIQSSVQNSYGFIQKKADGASPVGQGRIHGLGRLSAVNSGSHRSIPSLGAIGMQSEPSGPGNTGSFANAFASSSNFERALPAPSQKRVSAPTSIYSLPFTNPASSNQLEMSNMFEKWMDTNCIVSDSSTPGSSASDSFFNMSSDTLIPDDASSSSKGGFGSGINPARPTIRRQKMAYVAKFGDFGTGDGQFSEPSGVTVNAHHDILVADTNNHRVQIFDHEGRFKFAFGECGKRDGQMLYPNRVAVARNGDVVVTERSPTHQIQVYNQYGVFVRKFGADILQHPRGVTVDLRGRVIVVECKVMRVVIFEPSGRIYNKFSCSQHLEFPNGVATNDNDEIFISDNRAHCVKVFNYHGIFLRQIGGEGITNFPIGVCITERGHVVVADNHNNFNLTLFRQDGTLLSAYESRVKHAQCFDVTLMDEGSVVLASKDYKVYVYRFAGFGANNGAGNFPVMNNEVGNFVGSRGTSGVANRLEYPGSPMKNLVKSLSANGDY